MNIRRSMLIVKGGYYNTWTERVFTYCATNDIVSIKYGWGHCNSGYAHNPYLYEFCFTDYFTDTFALLIFCSIHIKVVHINMLNRRGHAYDHCAYNSSPKEEGVVNVSISLCSSTYNMLIFTVNYFRSPQFHGFFCLFYLLY
jgi:uncharacterized membrane protein